MKRLLDVLSKRLLWKRNGAMIYIETAFRIFDIRHVGTCATCMRISFMTMLLSWVSVLASVAFDTKATMQVSAGSVFFTLLWLAHILRYAARSTPSYDPQNKSRRLAIRFGVALISGAAISVAFPFQAHADSGCGGWAGNSGCEPCSNYGNARCMRQNASCGCYYCRSCGEDCGNNVC